MQITETDSASSLFSTNALSKQLESQLEAIVATNTSEDLSKVIQTDFVGLCDYYIAIADQYDCDQEDSSTTIANELYLLHFALPELFKDIVLLHRDIFLQLQIAEHKYLENLVTLDAVNEHFTASKNVLIQAISTYKNTVKQEYDAINFSEKEKNKAFSNIKHRKNPWHIYKSQFIVVNQQLKEIKESGLVVTKAIKVFNEIKLYNAKFLNDIIVDTEALKSLMGETIKTVKSLENQEEISAIVSWLDNKLYVVDKEANWQERYMLAIEDKMITLKESSIAINTLEGHLLKKQIHFNKAIKKWFSFEILPALIDVWENRTNMASFFNHSFSNLKSSLLVEKNNNSLDAMPSQLNTLKESHNTLTLNHTKIVALIDEISEKVNDRFAMTQIYTSDDFLEVSLQSSLTQFTTGRSGLLSIVRSKIKNLYSRFNKTYESNLLFSNQSTIEKAIHCINYRTFKEANAHYDTLFLNKNFIGDLFLRPRVEQESVLVKSLEQWKSGFNKPVLIIGDALSGKSTFAEYIAQKYFPKHALLLERDSSITFSGRKFNTTNNLKEALQNVKKGVVHSKTLLVIDDLELWKDEQSTLLDNVRALIDFMESESDEVLVLVTTSKEMEQQLNKRLRFSEAFSTTIDINKSSFDEIYKAFLLRHGASHKVLVNKNQEPMTSKQIEGKVHKLARQLGYNIGEVLQAWTFGTTLIEGNKVIYEQQDTDLKDFFNGEEIIILKYVLIHKQINEVLLKSFVGKQYDVVYSSGMKRLINTKVLLRDINGQLRLNPVLSKDVKQLLIYRGILK